jgi:hypothetical protein
MLHSTEIIVVLFGKSVGHDKSLSSIVPAVKSVGIPIMRGGTVVENGMPEEALVAIGEL